MGFLMNMRAIRRRRGLTQAQLAEAIGVEQPTVQRYENGTRDPSLAQALEIAKVLGVSLDELTQVSDTVALGPRLFVKGAVAAGVWREAWEFPEDEWETYTGRADVSAPVRERFGLRVEGESMNELYPPGTVLDCVAYHGDHQIENGKRIIVQRVRNGGEYETTCKEYFRDPDGIEWLVPRSFNPAFQRRYRVNESDDGISEAKIIGIVVASIRPE
jgi:transcriptional regulator with XRE-family HTH domain